MAVSDDSFVDRLLYAGRLEMLVVAHQTCKIRISGGGGIHGSGLWLLQNRAIRAASTASVFVRSSSLWANALMRAGLTTLTCFPSP